MVDVTHNWDEENYTQTLEDAYTVFKTACYGAAILNPVQSAEVRRAFLFGIHWMNTRDNYCPDEIERALRGLLDQPASSS